MKRGQVAERNLGHWGFEVQHPIAPPELGLVEQSSTPRNFGVTTRRLRFTRSSSRNDRECINASHEDSGAPVVTSDRVLRSSQARISSSVSSAKEGSESSLEIYKDHISEIVATSRSGVDESGQHRVTPELRIETSPTDTEKSHRVLREDDRGKENVDPLGDCGGTPSGSPLPEWFPRNPLQDITNVLAAELVRSPAFYISRFSSFSFYFQCVNTCLVMSASSVHVSIVRSGILHSSLSLCRS